MKKLIFALVMLAGSMSFAGKCVLHVTRVPCPGKDAESFKKCDGKPDCDVVEDEATTEEQCKAKAQSECANSRFDITKSKTYTAKFDGKELVGPFDGQFCNPKHPDYNKCK